MSRLSVFEHFLIYSALVALSIFGQAPTGTISGTITDETGAVVPNTKVTVHNKDTGAVRELVSGPDGSFTAASLPAGNYEVRAEATGFRVMVRPAVVETGSTTTVSLSMQVGTTKDVVTVEGATSEINYESNTVQGVVRRAQIESLPLNGRNFLSLAQLEPGVLVTAANPAQFNAQFSVSILGGPASHTNVTVDGGNVRNPVEGGVGTNFSQEVVQEFQMSSVNFDLSTGITAFGAVNVVTRSGSNDLHGTGYLYYRDHNMAAYPGLTRQSLAPDPYFARKQPGFWLGGPLKKDKLFFFGNFEYMNQKSVYVLQPDLPSMSAFASVTPAPYIGKQLGVKMDYRINEKTSAFIRYSHDGNHNSGPFGVPVPPSNFVANQNWSDQSLLGVTSVLSPTLVNDLRFSYWYWQNRNIPAPCGTCLGGGGPETFFIGSVNFALGNNFNSPQGRDLRRYPLSDNVTWQKGIHRIKFGGEWEHDRGTGYWGFFDPARVYLLAPESLGPAAALYGIVGGKVNNYADIMKLPVVAFILGIGDRAQPSYNLPEARGNDRLHFYVQDTWKLNKRLTLNFGLGWEYETNVLNYDLARPSLLAPLLGPDLSPPAKQGKNFMPAVGFAWNVGKSNRTVIRAGAGIFYDTQLGWWRLGERAVLGGSGRQFIGNASVVNPGPNFPGIPAGATFSNFAPYYAYTMGAFLAQLPTLRAQQQALFPGTSNTPQILESKQANALGAIYPHDFPTTQAQHFNVGIQHELGRGLVVTADFVYRHVIHATPGGFFGASVDYNRFYSVSGPIIPACQSQAQAINPTTNCSAGPINFWWPGATAQYKALLVKADKRFSRRFMFTTAYSLQDSKSINDVTQNLNNYFSSYGPDQPRHNLNMSGMVDLPWGFQFSLISSVISRPPVQPTITGVDITGTNTQSSAYTPLPGMQYNQFLSQGDLAKLVSSYNSTYAGKATPAAAAGVSPGQTYPAITLPAHYNLGHMFTSQDIRVTKLIKYKEHLQVRIFGEAFNLLNVGNLTLDNFALNNPATFGQATQRVGQTFGSGGPRAFQFGARVSF